MSDMSDQVTSVRYQLASLIAAPLIAWFLPSAWQPIVAGLAIGYACAVLGLHLDRHRDRRNAAEFNAQAWQFISFGPDR